ncbi:MAG: GtrA family protein [Kiritimatiellae bacterium]|nr:GtrA family protein [Kiritimatiellia bacterium]
MKGIIRQFFQREAHPLVQFLKYGLAGGVATVVQVSVFYALSIWVFPCLTEGDKVGDFVARWFSIMPVDISDQVRALRFVLNTFIGFIFSNLVCYIINILWVFKRGRHHWLMELLLFYAVSGISLGVGTFLGWFTIRMFGMHTTYSFLLQMFASLMINYVCRKYIIFKG